MLLTELRKRPLPSFEGGGGPPPSVLAIARRGESLSRLVLQGYDEGAITITDASEALGTKVQQLVKIRKLLAGEADE
jgi:hypothetical protein